MKQLKEIINVLKLQKSNGNDLINNANNDYSNVNISMLEYESSKDNNEDDDDDNNDEENNTSGENNNLIIITNNNDDAERNKIIEEEDKIEDNINISNSILNNTNKRSSIDVKRNNSISSSLKKLSIKRQKK